MAKLYGDRKGEIIRQLLTEGDEAQYPDAPTEATTSLEFDEADNPAVVSMLQTEPHASFALKQGVLYRNGVPVPIVPSTRAVFNREVLAYVQPIVGKKANDLVTLLDQHRFRVALAHKLGALNTDWTIKPLSEWLGKNGNGHTSGGTGKGGAAK